VNPGEGERVLATTGPAAKHTTFPHELPADMSDEILVRGRTVDDPRKLELGYAWAGIDRLADSGAK
jgi:hypothetical protein